MCPRHDLQFVWYFLNYSGKVDAKVHSERHRRSPKPSGGLEIILLAKFAISDEKRRYLAHTNPKELQSQCRGYGPRKWTKKDDIRLFDDDQADEDNIIVLENDEAYFS